MPSDEELIANYLRGNEVAFSDLVERHLKGVYTFAVRFVGSERDAEDIVQESFLKAWKNIGRYSSESARFKTWLMRIVRNTAIDYLRKHKEVPFSQFESEEDSNPFENIGDDAPDAAELLALKYDQEKVGAVIQQLSPAHREVLLLYYGGDRTFEEVAAVTGESINTIKSRHRRAIHALRNLLTDKG